MIVTGPNACLVELREVDDVLSTWTPGAILTAEEQARAQRFALPGPARTFIAGRLLLRSLAARMAGCRPEDVVFSLGPHGKPMVEHPRGVEVNLSHSGGRVLAAAGSVPLGVDMEAVRPLDWRAIARRFLPARDHDWLAAFPIEERRRAFFQLWTWKEAVAKALGVGIALLPDLPPPDSIVEVGGSTFSVSRLDLPEPLVGHLTMLSLERPRPGTQR